MNKKNRRLSRLILWEIILLFLLALVFTYMPIFVELESLGDILENLLPPLLMILFVLIITKLFVSLLEPVFKRALRRYISSSYNIKHTWQFISYLIWISAFTVLSFLLVGDLLTIGIFSSVLILIIILVSHRAIVNFAGWLHIIFGSRLQRGDLVEIDKIKGRIKEVSTMNIILEEKSESLKEEGFTGRKVTIPNSFIFTKPVFSISQKEDIIWDEIKILLTSSKKYLIAEDIMSEVAKSIVGPIMKKRHQEMKSKVYSSEKIPTIPTTELTIEKEGVQIVLRYFCKVSERAEVRSAISEGILKEFEKEDIKIVFKR